MNNHCVINVVERSSYQQGAVWRYSQYLGDSRSEVFPMGLSSWPISEAEMKLLRPAEAPVVGEGSASST